MIIKNVFAEDLSEALEELNKKYDNNVIWNNYEQLSRNRFRVTLRVLNCKGKGHRLGFYRHPKTGNRRRLISACWHCHGDFFDILLRINSQARIKTSRIEIYKQQLPPYGTMNNWQDWNIGSILEPFFYSEACDC